LPRFVTNHRERHFKTGDERLLNRFHIFFKKLLENAQNI
jgi:hypothetical protein